VASCQNDEGNLDLIGPLPDDPVFMNLQDLINPNARISFTESSFTLYKAEYFTSGEDNKVGRTIFFSDRGNKQLEGDFVPILELCLDGKTDISYYVDGNRPSADIAVGASTVAIR
jgi:hypothetical protein